MHKMGITKELGLLEKERPWIAVTVKTKQACTSTLTSMKATIDQLKVEGNELASLLLTPTKYSFQDLWIITNMNDCSYH